MRSGSLLLLAGLLLGGACLATSSFAGPNANAKVLIHVSRWHGPKNAWMAGGTYPYCTNTTVRPACSGILTRGELYPPGLYPYTVILATDGDAAVGFGTMECSIDYDPTWGVGVDVFGWFTCYEFATMAGPYGDWPAPQSTLLVKWNGFTAECQTDEPGGSGTGVIAVAGFLYTGAYSADILRVIPSPASGVVRVTTCAGVPDTVAGAGVIRVPSHLGYAAYSLNQTEPGYNPCGLATPVVNTTWSRLKLLER